MKRDMEMVTRILRAIEATNADFLSFPTHAINKYTNDDPFISDDVIHYHIWLCYDAGFAVPNNAHGYYNPRLTWAGHNFLDELNDAQEARENV